jgi:hypothetical protein
VVVEDSIVRGNNPAAIGAAHSSGRRHRSPCGVVHRRSFRPVFTAWIFPTRGIDRCADVS